MKTIAIIGAAGRVGNAAARAFVEAGWRVRGIGRNARVSQMAPGVEPVSADAFDAKSLIEACAGADVVLNAANPPYDKWETTVLTMAKNALEAAKATGATHMLPGNVYNFGHGISTGMKEDGRQVASTDKARIRIELENMCRSYAERDGVQTIILRAGDFYGGDKPESWLDIMILKDVKKDVFTWPGPWNVAHAFAYLPDLATAFVALAERRGELERFDRFHFAGHTLTGEQMHAAAEKAVGRKLKRKNVNWTMIRIAGLFMPLLREVVKMSYLWRTAHSLDGAKLERAIGPVAETPPSKAIAEAVAELDLDRHRQAMAA